MNYLPLFADLRGVPCLLIGTGRMAEEKAALLRRSGADIWRRSSFNPDEAKNVYLIMADVDTEEAEKIRAFGKRRRIFVNIVDKPEYCSFIVPAIVERGDLLLGISTSGKSPALSGWIRRKLEKLLGPEYELLLDVLGRTRHRVQTLLPSYGDRKELYYGLFDGGILDEARSGDADRVEESVWEKAEEFSKCNSCRER